MQKTPHFLIIGNPENRRITYFQEALKQNGYSIADVISYSSLLKGELLLSDRITPRTIIRIESPGENFDVEKRLIAYGEFDKDINSPISADEILAMDADNGRILYPGQWYSGYKKCLLDILTQAREACFGFGSYLPQWMNHPNDIVLMFDKTQCSAMLNKISLPTPRMLPGIDSYDTLLNEMDAFNINRVFLKLRYSSSASGIIAYVKNKRCSREFAYSTIECVYSNGIKKYYNSLKVKKYTSPVEIRNIINFICSEGVHVEEWVPKPMHNGCSYDIRIVVINRKAFHSVVRLSKSPFTNLHLGNSRAAIKDVIDKDAIIKLITSTASHSMGVFQRSLYSGIDIMVPSGRTPLVLEINAFGDLIPGIGYNGLTTYYCEILECINNLVAKDNAS